MHPAAPAFAIILAGGRAMRFGGDKLSAPWRGRPVLAHVIAAVQAAEAAGTIRTSYVVVPGPHAPAAQVAASLGARTVLAPEANRGMGWNLRAGLAAVRRTAPLGPAALLVVLGDQPTIRPDVMAALVRRWRATGAACLRPRYAGAPETPGHPVLLDRVRWDEIDGLTSDHGLGALLGNAELLDVDGDNPDVDTRADLAALDQGDTA